MSVIAGLALGASAQVCTPDSTHFTAGVYVYPPSLPCITQGTAYSGTVSIKIPDSIDAHLFVSALPANTYFLYVDSMRIDSITGAPSGIAVATNPADSVWLYGGQYGCAQFSGTTSAAVGSYPLNVYGRGCVHGTIFSLPIDSCLSGSLSSYFSYSLSVCASTPPTVCTPDTAAFTPGVTVYPASLPCIIQSMPFSGTVSIRVPDSIDAHTVVSALPANTYYVHIDSIFIDSINGTPAGITGVTNPGDSVWLHGGQYACAQFSGTTTAPIGNYPLNIHGRGCVHGNILGFAIDSCVSGSLASYIRYSLNVCPVGGGGACTVDTTQFSAGTYVYPASLPCIVTGEAFTGQVNIQVPVSVDAHDFNSTIPAGVAQVTIDSININSITGYPAGISSVSNPVLSTWLYPSSYACALITGTVNAAVTPAGNYPLTISGTGCGHISYNGTVLYSTCMTNYSFTNIYPYSLNVCYPAGISQITDGVDLRIYPNPNQGTFTVALSSSARIIGTMSVLDQLGRILYTENIDMTGAKQIPLDLGNISAGAYILMINTGDSKSMKQFIVR